jgi:TonB family protein
MNFRLTSGGFIMNAHVLQAGAVSGRSSVMLIVIGLHLALIMGLMAMNVVVPRFDPGPGRVKVTRIDEPKRLPPVVQTVNPSGEALRPIPNRPLIAEYPELPPIAIGETTETQPIAMEPVGTGSTPIIKSTPLIFRVTRPTDDYYPALSIRAGEEGIAQIRVCVGASGEINLAPTVAVSSGYRRLDAAALTWASESLRFTPATEAGQAVAMCKGIRVNFRLR